MVFKRIYYFSLPVFHNTDESSLWGNESSLSSTVLYPVIKMYILYNYITYALYCTIIYTNIGARHIFGMH